MSSIQFRSVDSPVGLLTLAGRDGRLMHLRMVDQTYEPSHDGWECDDTAFPDAVEQLESYFAGELFDFELDLDMVGTSFQRSVWAALLTIPYGRDPVIRGDRSADRFAERITCGRVGQRPQSDRHHRAVPSGDRRQRQPHRIRRWIGPQTRIARIGEKSKSRNANAFRLNNSTAQKESPPTQLWGVILICVRRCPTFPPGLGSIIGAGRLSFRVRDGSGRFPVAISAVTLFTCCCEVLLVVGCSLCCLTVWFVVARFWLCVSFRPVSASSLCPLLGVQVWSIDPVVCGGPYPT